MRGGGGKISSDDNSFRLLFFSGNRRVVSVRFVCSQPLGGFPVWRRLFFLKEKSDAAWRKKRGNTRRKMVILVDPFLTVPALAFFL